MRKLFVLLGLICLIFCCRGNDNKVKEVKEKYYVFDSTDCFIKPDTLLSSGDYLKTVKIDSNWFGVKVRLAKNDTILPYKFDCSVPNGLIPKLYKNGFGKMCLIRGSGQTFREYIVIWSKDGTLKGKKFESGEYIDLSNNLVVYRDSINLKLIHLENFVTDKKCELILPEDYEEGLVDSIKVYNRKINIFFLNKKKIILANCLG